MNSYLFFLRPRWLWPSRRTVIITNCYNTATGCVHATNRPTLISMNKQDKEFQQYRGQDRIGNILKLYLSLPGLACIKNTLHIKSNQNIPELWLSKEFLTLVCSIIQKSQIFYNYLKYNIFCSGKNNNLQIYIKCINIHVHFLWYVCIINCLYFHTGKEGIQIPMASKRHLDYFKLYLTDHIVEHIVIETNRYVCQVIQILILQGSVFSDLLGVYSITLQYNSTTYSRIAHNFATCLVKSSKVDRIDI